MDDARPGLLAAPPDGAGEMRHYRRVKQALLGLMRSGALPPGARLPSEHDIVRDYGVSRMTANRALRELMAEGAVTRRAGAGSFVARPRLRGEMLEIRNIADEIAERGHAHACRVIARETCPASPAVAAALERPAGAAVLHTLIVHLEDDAPIQIEDRYVNPAIAPDYLGVDFSQDTAHRFLSERAPISSFEHVIEAVLPDAAARRLLLLRRTQPCLRLFRRTWSGAVPVTCVWLTHSAALYCLRAGQGLPLGTPST
jgi:GntR family histidine utilization transcriptional repressor